MIFKLPSTPPQTPEQVRELIHAFCNDDAYKHLMPDFSFAHIALSDFNLSNGHIDWCIEPDRVAEWFNARLAEILADGEKPTSPHSWERFRFTKLLSTTDDTIEFMRYLKDNVSENVREAVNIQE